MTKFSQKITEKIQEEKIKQTPHWVFLLKNVAFWVLFGVAMLLGAIAFAVILFSVLEADFELWGHPAFSRLQFALHILPLYWLIAFLIFCGLALVGMQHTKKGYRLPVWKLLVGNLLGSILLGGSMYAFGGGEKFEHFFAQRFPGYQNVDKRQEEIWSNPEGGLLAGKIVAVESDKLLILQDFSQKIWEVTLPENPLFPKAIDSDLVREKLKDRNIKILGKKTGENSFLAEAILPWQRRRQRPAEGRERRPEERLMLLMQLHQAIENGNEEAATRIQEELQNSFPSPPPPPQ
jgi:hypothetical protein